MGQIGVRIAEEKIYNIDFEFINVDMDEDDTGLIEKINDVVNFDSFLTKAT